jgi:hypothetical protein
MQANKISLIAMMMFCNMSYADYDADKLEQLFTNKSQRAQIDATRSGNYSGTEERKTQKIKVEGYVTRSNGKSVAWVNNKNTLESSSIGDVKVHHSSIGKNKKVTVSVEGKRARLRPGEVWHKESGKIVDSQ